MSEDEMTWVNLTSIAKHQKEELYKLLIGKKSIDWGKVNEIFGVSDGANYDVNALIDGCGLTYCGYCGLIFRPEEQYLFRGGSVCKPCYKEAMSFDAIKYPVPPSNFHSTQKYFNHKDGKEEELKVVSLVLKGNEDCKKSLEQLVASDNDFDLKEEEHNSSSCLLTNAWVGADPCGWGSDALEMDYEIKLRVEFDDGTVVFESISKNVEQLVVESRGVSYSCVSKEEY